MLAYGLSTRLKEPVTSLVMVVLITTTAVTEKVVMVPTIKSLRHCFFPNFGDYSIDQTAQLHQLR